MAQTKSKLSEGKLTYSNIVQYDIMGEIENEKTDVQAMPTHMVSENTRNPKSMPNVQIRILEHEQKREERLKSYKNLTIKTCIECGLEFKMPVWYETHKERGMYCSKRCRGIHEHKQAIVKRTCVNCGKEFEVIKRDMNRGRGLYCSFECFKKRPTTTIKKTCKKCGNLFEIRPYEIHGRRTGEYCSIECATKENNLWKGGVSFEPYCPKFNYTMKQRIRAFFNNECVICGKTKEENKKNMSCHHIEYNKNTCCDNSKPYFATVCDDHHRRTNGERERWTAILKRIIDELYDGKSYYTKEEWKAIKEERKNAR